GGPSSACRTLTALRGGFRLAVAGARRAGLGPLRADLSGSSMRSAGLAGAVEMTGRLALSPAHVIFGHTHRTGMLAGDDAGEWRTPAGTRLHNAGCWVFETHFMGPARGESPYWPGGAVALDDKGPPRLERLLGDIAEDVLCGRGVR
ncbi:MAG: hypothetical protein ACR2LK_07755, partial [Solirubrobacteraceae bacterium]